MTNNFTKADLKTGMVVEYRNGERRLVIDNRLIGEISWNRLEDNYNDNLTHSFTEFEEFSIDKVYKPDMNGSFTVILNHAHTGELLFDRTTIESEPDIINEFINDIQSKLDELKAMYVLKEKNNDETRTA